MDLLQIAKIILIIILTVLSGFGDSQGFVHSASVWADGKLVWNEVLNSALGYAFGIIMYWGAVRFLQEFGVVSPEIQTLGWFVVTIIGVAIFSGNFAKWQMIDQVFGIAIVIGIGWLTVRTGG